MRPPARCVAAVTKQFGDAGQRWLDGHEAVLTTLAERWQIEIGDAFTEGWPTNVVYSAYRDDARLVLKTGYPNPELFTELKVLQRWQGRPGCVQLVEADESLGVMLMERIAPGTMFRHTDLATRSTSIPQLFEAVLGSPAEVSDFPCYSDWIEGAFLIYRQSGESVLLPHIQSVESLFTRFLTAYPVHYLLHGDLHHLNMLEGGADGWVAIDPKGIVGPRVLDYGRFMHNFIADEVTLEKTSSDIVLARADTLAGEFEPAELIAVGYIDLVLSICWTLNDGGTLSDEHKSLLQCFRNLI